MATLAPEKKATASWSYTPVQDHLPRPVLIHIPAIQVTLLLRDMYRKVAFPAPAETLDLEIEEVITPS